jgi:hypothetical protein
MQNSRLFTNFKKYLWSHPAAGITIDASVIDIEVAIYVFGSTLV